MWTFVFIWCDQFHREAWGNCLFQSDAWLTGCEATHKEVMELWHENCKLIWKYETDMKIWNWYENIKRPRRNHTSKGENMKLIWKYETAQFDILMFLCIVPTWMFDIFILDAAGMKIHLAGIKTRSQRKNGLPCSYVDVCNMETAGMKTCSGERMFRLDCNVDNKNSKRTISQNLPRFICKYLFLCDTVWIIF